MAKVHIWKTCSPPPWANRNFGCLSSNVTPVTLTSVSPFASHFTFQRDANPNSSTPRIIAQCRLAHLPLSTVNRKTYGSLSDLVSLPSTATRSPASHDVGGAPSFITNLTGLDVSSAALQPLKKASEMNATAARHLTAFPINAKNVSIIAEIIRCPQTVAYRHPLRFSRPSQRRDQIRQMSPQRRKFIVGRDPQAHHRHALRRRDDDILALMADAGEQVVGAAVGP